MFGKSMVKVFFLIIIILFQFIVAFLDLCFGQLIITEALKVLYLLESIYSDTLLHYNLELLILYSNISILLPYSSTLEGNVVLFTPLFIHLFIFIYKLHYTTVYKAVQISSNYSSYNKLMLLKS